MPSPESIAFNKENFRKLLKKTQELVEWIEDILNKIQDHPMNGMDQLLPNNWKTQQ